MADSRSLPGASAVSLISCCLRFFPIVVAEQEVSAGVVQLEGRIGQRAGHAETGQ